MQHLTRLPDLRQWRVAQTRASRRVAFVPTMGNLHAGHLSLMERARASADCVIASIYVNPLQFDRPDDLSRYPRTLQADIEALESMGVDALFLPDDTLIYPRGMHTSTRVEVPVVSEVLCGAHRPGHFVGVSTVVTKLFNLVQPDVAVFGQKDFQQLLIIRRMVEDLNVTTEIISAPTLRESNGLAMSSRNNYLSEAEREQGAQLYRCLLEVAERLIKGERDYAALEQNAQRQLEQAGFKPDYVSVLHSHDLSTPVPHDTITDLVVLAAAELGKARLIDNIVLSEYLERG